MTRSLPHILALAAVLLSSPVLASKDHCRTPEAVIGVFASMAKASGLGGNFWRRPAEDGTEVVVTQFRGGPADIHVFADGCYLRTYRGPLLWIHREAA